MSIFSSISARKPKKNKFDLSHERKFSLAMGKLIPIYIQDVVPGDQFRVNSELFLRMAPMRAPIMHRVNVYTHYFFVPNRLLWNEWEDFITGGKEGNLSPVAPYGTFNSYYVEEGMYKRGSLADYMGLPTIEADESVGAGQNQRFSVLPFRAYQSIFNEYYRDQNLSDPVDFNLNSGEDTELINLLTLRNRAWEKDYFTSALPWSQRGGDVHVPFSFDEDSIKYSDVSTVKNPDGTLMDFEGYLGTTSGAFGLPGELYGGKTLPENYQGQARIENIDSIEGSGTTINDLRRSVKLQEWLEKNARGGARYIEQILSHFGVRSSDSRLQRPEYLGGGRQPVTISEVLSTFQDVPNDGDPLASMAGHGVSVGKSNGFKRFFEEHGYVIGIMSVLPKSAYQQGIPRHFQRKDKFDYYWPEFAHIGEQAIKNNELFYNPSQSVDLNEDTFGYSPRYAEYKFTPSSVHGEFRDSLAFWHLGRIFGTRPTLSEQFITAREEEMKRIFAVEDDEHLYCQLYNSVSALRPMPYFGTPSF